MKTSTFLLAALFVLLSLPIRSYAIAGTYPFGGNIISVLPCTCVAQYAGQSRYVVVGPPRPGAFMYIPEIPGIPGAGTDLRAFYSIVPGSYVLGLSTLVPIGCWQQASAGCFTSGFAPMMILAGTSYPI